MNLVSLMIPGRGGEWEGWPPRPVGGIQKKWKATGWETSVDDLWTLAMRQLNLEKAFNLRHTEFGRKDDMPTPRDLNEPVPTGALKGWKIDVDRWNPMLDHYYELHGWDAATGFPTRKTLEALGLANVADDLQRLGKLGRQQ